LKRPRLLPQLTLSNYLSKLRLRVESALDIKFDEEVKHKWKVIKWKSAMYICLPLACILWLLPDAKWVVLSPYGFVAGLFAYAVTIALKPKRSGEWLEYSVNER